MSTTNQDKCFLHNQKRNSFCHNDEELVCLVCQQSKEHKVHVCCPVEEAAEQKKTQACETETGIKEEFKKLHQFLKEEENTRLQALKQEEETKTQIMCMKLENIEEQINTLSSTINDIETALKAQDVQLLQDYKKTKKMLQWKIGEPEVIRVYHLINSAKHLGSLKFSHLEEGGRHCQMWWVKEKDFTLNLSYFQLTEFYGFQFLLFWIQTLPISTYSEELSCVQYSSKKLLPNNPERLVSRISVLGATGFTSGKHSWTVDVGQGKDWYIGVALDSIQRKNTIFLSPAEGFWVIGLSNGDSLWAQTTPRSKLPMKEKPNRITVELDYDRGKVVFINAADSTKIHTFKDKFTEKVFPYFSPGLCKDVQNASPLTICPQIIKVKVE
ncbi:E3 ubiquitin-protein ligase TRIM39 isoform X2 [Maylandia zebra]|uniref:E3 ubiquitin-protein ligase TRIM39 isoform X2 n=1 Tax=Maylandia zebra TaxID=106582 RepID=UPI00403C84B4